MRNVVWGGIFALAALVPVEGAGVPPVTRVISSSAPVVLARKERFRFTMAW